MDTTVVTENEDLRTHQLRVLRAAGIDRVDARVRHLLATGRAMVVNRISMVGSVFIRFTHSIKPMRI